jgi:hypothetical protein
MGEYGFHLGQVDGAEKQGQCTVNMVQWCLEWGCPFILYWEIYCNEIEPSTGEHRGFWLIDKDGEKQPAWHVHNDFLKKANAYVSEYEKQHGKLPDQAEYNQEAATWLITDECQYK